MNTEAVKQLYNTLANIRDEIRRNAATLRASTVNGNRLRRDKVSEHRRALASEMDAQERGLTDAMVQGLKFLHPMILVSDVMYLYVAAMGERGTIGDLTRFLDQFSEAYACRDQARNSFWAHYQARYPRDTGKG